MSRSIARGLGVAEGTALFVAAVLGSGVLVLPALAAAAAGPAAIAAVAVLAVISVPLVATFAALSRRHPDAGGVATFARRAFGADVARVTSYWFYFGMPLGVPVAGLMTARYVVAVVGGGWPATFAVAIVLMAVPLVIAFFGVRVAGRVQLLLGGALMAVLIFVLAVAAPHGRTAALVPFLPHGLGGVGTAISLYVWAFVGWEAVAGVAGEFRDPRRDVPRAATLALVIVGLMYLALQTVTVTSLGARAATTAAPLLDMVLLGLGSGWAAVVAAVAVVITLGTYNAYYAAFGKLGAAMGRDGELPRWFAAGAESGGVPRRSLALFAALFAAYCVPVFLIRDLAPVVLVFTTFSVAIYGVAVASALRLLKVRSVGWWAAAASVVLVLGLLAIAAAHLVSVAVLAAAALGVGARRRVRRRRLARAGP